MRSGLFLFSAAVLAFEITLTRLFSVAQFYHFSFMIVSIALLGGGASGTVLAVFPQIVRSNPRRSVSVLALAASVGLLASYLLINWLPFDSFSMAVDRRQIVILVLHYVALALPFLFNGMAVGILLAAFARSAGQTYAVNLLGAATGCALALVAPSLFGGEGMVVLCSGLAALAALVCGDFGDHMARKAAVAAVAILLVLFALADLTLRLAGGSGFPFLTLRLSPYKGLSYALQYPGAQILYRRWNAFSRVDVVRSGGIHSLPGLSYQNTQPLPSQDGLFVDGDDLSVVLPADADTRFTAYLPAALAFHLRPGARTLVLEPRGGLDLLTALALGADQVTAVEVNPLIVEAALRAYRDPRVRLIVESDRSYLRRTKERYDVILFSLVSSYHPVRSGAYSLVEDYRYTLESFRDAMAHLAPDGLMVVTRWIQNPPSEDLRAFALAVTALESMGADPRAQIVAFRGYNTATLVLKNGRFSSSELPLVRNFTAARAFDLTYAPDIQPEETNRYNIHPESIYYDAYLALLTASPRQSFYAAYPYDVTPPTDDRPFFGHYFKWSQAGQIWAELGKTWQPFGGAGYFVILVLLVLAVLLAGMIILLPVVFRHRSGARSERPSVYLYPFAYFAFIGLAFLLVEIPLIQRFILYVGQPSYAMTAVIFSLLSFSALGSRLSHRLPLRPALAGLTLLLLVAPFWLSPLLSWTLGLPLAVRLGLTLVLLAPLGFLMGIPFPAGIRWLRSTTSTSKLMESILIAWAWAINGTVSVVAAMLAALLALSFGFHGVLRIGALCYAATWLTAAASASRR